MDDPFLSGKSMGDEEDGFSVTSLLGGNSEDGKQKKGIDIYEEKE